MKKFILLAAAALALSLPAAAKAADVEDGGGCGLCRVCNNGWVYVYYGGSWGWRPTGEQC